MPPNGDPVTAPAALAPALAAYKAVTADRLTKPDDGDWLMFRRTYNGWGYSPLDQITTANASHLHPVWSMATGQIEGHQAPPIVNNGVMFVATPGNQVLAVNAKTGDLLWRFKRPIPEDQFLLHPTSRGVALWGNKVFFAASDATLVALDAKTGKEVWNKTVEDYTKGYYMSLAPLVIDGKVLVGTSGGELGVRGFVVAFDAENGKELWRTSTDSLRPARPAVRPGPRAISGRLVAARSGSPVCMILRPASLSGALAMAAHGWAISGPAITFTPRQSSRSTLQPARSRAIISIIRIIRGTGTRYRRRSSSTM